MIGRLLFAAVSAAVLATAAIASPLAVLILSPTQAEAVRTATAGREERLEPRLIMGGPHAGSYALPVVARTNPAFADQGDILNAASISTIETDDAWPDTGV